MIIRDRCPQCYSKQFKKNGHLPSGKQSYRCNDCGQQFVLDFEQRLVSDEDRELIKRLLCERLSLLSCSDQLQIVLAEEIPDSADVVRQFLRKRQGRPYQP